MQARSTPARAGTTWRYGCPSAATRVYPRSRGDHKNSLDNVKIAAGLPPLARGPRRLWNARSFGSRSTPARAGTTRVRPATCGQHSVYPRSRGDHDIMSRISGYIVGLPPLARGPQSFDHRLSHVDGSTPARAGTTR